MKCCVCNKQFVPSSRTLKRSCYTCKRALSARRKSQGGRVVRQSIPTPPHIAAWMPAMAERAALGLPLFAGRRV